MIARRSTTLFAACSLSVARVVVAQCPGELIHAWPLLWHRADFGWTVQLDDRVAVVGNPKDHTFCTTTTCYNGAVHVFRNAAGSWGHEAILFHSRISEFDGFGGAVAMDGPARFAATAPGEDLLGYRGGAAYIFEHNGEAWNEVAEILPPILPGQSGFGESIAAWRHAGGGRPGLCHPGHGQRRCRRRRTAPVDSGRACRHRLRLRAPARRIVAAGRQAAARDHRRRLGRAIDTDGAHVIVGAPAETVFSAPSTGAVHIFDLPCLLCRADLDGDGELTFFDFLAFQNLYAAGDMTADFDGDGALTFFDFLAFQNEFAAGCA